jgi:uncharacterized cysteine cluster protein YcgN (CxxCxxCC family)
MSKTTTQTAPYWETKALKDMSKQEWDGLCDGCGLCCLHKVEDEDSGAIAFSPVACLMLDIDSCQCKDYKNRKTHVPDCVSLNYRTVPTIGWLPESCAYRLLAEGQPLEPWHPLISGDPETVHAAGISLRGKAISEEGLHDIENYIEDWFNAGNIPLHQTPGISASSIFDGIKSVDED